MTEKTKYRTHTYILYKIIYLPLYIYLAILKNTHPLEIIVATLTFPSWAVGNLSRLGWEACTYPIKANLSNQALSS